MSKFVLTTKLSREQMKLALIPLLGLMLLAVLFWPSGNHVETVVIRPPRPVRTPTSPQAAVQTPATNWPKVRVEEVAAFSPFDPPAVAPPVPSVATNTAQENVNVPKESTPEPVIRGTLQAVYHTAGGTVAILDSQIVRVGDQLADGSRIVEITEQAILVARD